MAKTSNRKRVATFIHGQITQTAGVDLNRKPFVYRRQTSPRNPKI